jgi:predicted nucleotidyltransferase
MNRISKIQIDPAHELIVTHIINTYLPDGIIVWVFGSRATNRAKPFSDLDLALEAIDGTNVDPKIILSLENEFENSNLPWKVDVIDLNSVSETFKEIIKRDRIRFL